MNLRGAEFLCGRVEEFDVSVRNERSVPNCRKSGQPGARERRVVAGRASRRSDWTEAGNGSVRIATKAGLAVGREKALDSR